MQTADSPHAASREIASTVQNTAPALDASAGADAAETRLSWADGQLAGWVLLAGLSLVLNALRPGLAGAGLRTTLLQCLYPAGQLLAAGVVVGAATWAFRARGSRSMVWTTVATMMAGFTFGWTVLKDDLAQIQNRLAHHAPPLFWRGLFTLAVAATIPLALFVGRMLARDVAKSLLRWIGVALALVGHVVLRNHFFPQGFPGLHLMLAIAAASLAGGSLGGVKVPRIAARSSLPRRLGWGVATLWGACAVFVPPPAQVSFQMMQPPAASMAPFIAQLHAPAIPPSRTPEEAQEALSTAPPVPPSPAALLPKDGAVLLVTIDCFRADLLADDQYEAALPNLVALRRSAATFTTARSPGNFTIVALSSLFTGRYESQLAWADHETPHTRYHVPLNDPSPRLPEVLGAAGVRSSTVSGAEWLDGESGILRGFTDERRMGPPQGFALAEDVVTATIEGVERHSGGPLFVYLHLFDAHDPYDRAGERGTDFERYLGELALVDREAGRLFRAFDAKFGGRGAIVVTADHGEGFGEHHSTRHGSHVYEEVVRVPLLVRAPGVAPRAIPDAVSTIDLGPTVLDLFRVATPSTFMGRSLVPLLAGENAQPQPVAIESRGYVALVERNLKVLRRKRYGTIELYDLSIDPEEKNNLFREEDPVSTERLGAMDKFFDDVDRK